MEYYTTILSSDKTIDYFAIDEIYEQISNECNNFTAEVVKIGKPIEDDGKLYINVIFKK